MKLLQKTPLLVRVVSLYLSASFLFILSTTLTQPAYSTDKTAPPVVLKSIVKKTQISGTPVRIVVPRANIDISVIAGAYDRATDTWRLTNDKAQYIPSAAMPNNISGSTFVYGHATDPVFGRLSVLHRGDKAVVYTKNHHKFTYQYRSDLTVNPQSTDMLSMSSATPQLTLMTCTGLFSESRRVMFFNLVEVA